jgi:hypothetical protein
MARQQISLKQLAIDKDNTAILIAVGAASFILVFSLIAGNALLKQRSYQAKVIGKKKTALRQLKQNSEEVEKLKNSYQVFVSGDQNVLGGNAKGTGDKDGENSRLVLDALPSKYDFPGLATSLEKTFRPYGIESITGTDDEIAQAAASASASPQPVDIPFSLVVNSSAQSSKQALELFEKSIRPFQIQKIGLTGQAGDLKMTITGKTYFQPAKKFDVKTETVK